MTSRRAGPLLVYGLWGITLVAWAGTAIAFGRARHTRPAMSSDSVPTMDTIMTYNSAVLARTADSVIAADLFRFDRHPTHVSFGTPPIVAPPIVPPRPQVTLDGIIGGPPWRAILNGVPNHDGNVVVAPRDTIGGLRVRTIRHDTVIVQGRDTVWTFTVRH